MFRRKIEKLHNAGLIRSELLDRKDILDIYWNIQDNREIVGILRGNNLRLAHQQMEAARVEFQLKKYLLAEIHCYNNEGKNQILVNYHTAPYNFSSSLKGLEEFIGQKIKIDHKEFYRPHFLAELEKNILADMLSTARFICQSANNIPDLTAQPGRVNEDPLARLNNFKKSLVPIIVSKEENIYAIPSKKERDRFYTPHLYPDYFLPLTNTLRKVVIDKNKVLAAKDTTGKIYISVNEIANSLPEIAIDKITHGVFKDIYSSLDFDKLKETANHMMWNFYYAIVKEDDYIEV